MIDVDVGHCELLQALRRAVGFARSVTVLDVDIAFFYVKATARISHKNPLQRTSGGFLAPDQLCEAKITIADKGALSFAVGDSRNKALADLLANRLLECMPDRG